MLPVRRTLLFTVAERQLFPTALSNNAMRGIATLLSLAALLLGCESGAEPQRQGSSGGESSGGESAAEPEPYASSSGLIVGRDVQLSIGGPPSIHVKDTVGDKCGCMYLIRPVTVIRRRTIAGALVSASYADLTVGARVRVRTQLVLLSCPGQASADSVQILP
jgi:hypothetical protein